MSVAVNDRPPSITDTSLSIGQNVIRNLPLPYTRSYLEHDEAGNRITLESDAEQRGEMAEESVRILDSSDHEYFNDNDEGRQSAVGTSTHISGSRTSTVELDVVQESSIDSTREDGISSHNPAANTDTFEAKSSMPSNGLSFVPLSEMISENLIIRNILDIVTEPLSVRERQSNEAILMWTYAEQPNMVVIDCTTRAPSERMMEWPRQGHYEPWLIYQTVPGTVQHSLRVGRLIYAELQTNVELKSIAVTALGLTTNGMRPIQTLSRP